MKLALGNRVQNAQFSHTNCSARYLIFSYSVMPMLMLVLISHALILCICNSAATFSHTVNQTLFYELRGTVCVRENGPPKTMAIQVPQCCQYTCIKVA
jgi:hypothetical protein